MQQKKLAEEQIETARELVRKIILGCDGKWDELVGGFRDDGTRFVSCRSMFRSLSGSDSEA